MSQIHIINRSKVQKTVTGNDGQTYFIPPRRVSKLPNGVQVDGDLPKDLRITKPSK